MPRPTQQAAKMSTIRWSVERRQLGALTGLRFFAALAVVLDHYWTAFIWWDPSHGAPAASAPLPAGWLQLVHAGGYGVDCFFILSGFILSYTYVTADATLRGTRSAFWIARVARIYPIYLVGLALDVVPFTLRYHHLAGFLATIGSTPLLLQAWLPSIMTWDAWDPPSWSLSVEAFFYLLFPFIIVALAGRARRMLWQTSALCVVVFAMLPALLSVVVGAWRPGAWWTVDRIIYFNPLLRLPEFALGVVLGMLYIRRHQSAEQPDRTATSPARDLVLLALGLFAAALVMLPLPLPYTSNVFLLPVFAAAIALLAEGRGVIAKLLSLRVCVWLGEASYSIYILHAPLWAWLAWIASARFHVSLAAPMLFPLYLASVLAAASLSYRFIERPARAAIRARWEAWEARRATRRSRSAVKAATT